MMPLTMCSEGTNARIVSVHCGQSLKKRLHDLGVYDGTTIKVIKNDVSGPIIVKVKDSKLVLGRGQASKIMAQQQEVKHQNE